MNSTMERLKYINTMTDVLHFDTGLSKYSNIETLYSGNLPKKVICRLDLTTSLNEYFSDEFIKKYRNGIVNMAQGILNQAMMPDILKAFLQEDSKFRVTINKLFNDCPVDWVFGNYIPFGLAKCMLAYYEALHDSWVGHAEFLICESDGYAYFSIPKDYSITDSRYEVVSHD